MTARQFETRISEHGFDRFEHPLRYPTWRRTVDGVEQFVSRDNVRGGAFRLFLARNCVPALDLQREWNGLDPIEAESPWFSYVDAMERPAALDACWEFLSTRGFEWLADPQKLSPTDWLFRHNINIKGGEIIRPRGRLP